MGEKFYTLTEASEASGVSHHSIKVGCKNGTIAYVKYGEGTTRVHKRIPHSEVVRLRDSRTVTGPLVAPNPVDDIDRVIAATRAANRRSPSRRAA